jgi:hypothetical protein
MLREESGIALVMALVLMVVYAQPQPPSFSG